MHMYKQMPIPELTTTYLELLDAHETGFYLLLKVEFLFTVEL